MFYKENILHMHFLYYILHKVDRYFTEDLIKSIRRWHHQLQGSPTLVCQCIKAGTVSSNTILEYMTRINIIVSPVSPQPLGIIEMLNMDIRD